MDEITLLAVVGLLGGVIGLVLGLLVGNLRPKGQVPPPSSRRAPDKIQLRIEGHRQEDAHSPAKKASYVQPGAAIPVQQVSQPSAVLPGLPGEPKTQPPNLGPVAVFARALQTDIKAPAPTARSIAAQIDEILQEQLAGPPPP